MRTILLASVSALCSCASVAPAVNPGVELTPETSQDCATRCGELGMQLDAVVLIHNSAGCVCRHGAVTGSRAGAAAATGGAMLAIEEEEARRASEEAQEATPPAPFLPQPAIPPPTLPPAMP
jgi:hypothetical protein